MSHSASRIRVEVAHVEPYDSPESWNVLPSPTGVSFSRGNERTNAADQPALGTFSARFTSSGALPTNNDHVGRGRWLRVRGLDHTDTWRTLWSGVQGDAESRYGVQRNRVTTIPATDAVARLDAAKAQRANYTSGVYAQQVGHALETDDTIAAGQTYINGASNIAENSMGPAPKESCLARLATVLDSWPRCWAWVSRESNSPNEVDHLTAWDAGSVPQPEEPVLVFSDLPDEIAAGALDFTDVEVAYDTEHHANAFVVNEVVGATKTRWRSTYLQDRNGFRPASRDLTICPSSSGTIAYNTRERMRDILGYQPVLGFAAQTVTLNALKHPRLLKDDLLYRVPVRVRFRESNAVYRIIREEHEVSGRSWLITYTLKRIRPRDDLAVGPFVADRY